MEHPSSQSAQRPSSLTKDQSGLFEVVSSSSWHIRHTEKLQRIDELLKKGVRLDCQDKNGRTPLHMAMPKPDGELDSNQLEIFKILVKRVCTDSDEAFKKRVLNELKETSQQQSVWLAAASRSQTIEVLFASTAPLPEEKSEVKALLIILIIKQFHNLAALTTLTAQLGSGEKGIFTSDHIENNELIYQASSSLFHLSLEVYPKAFSMLMQFSNLDYTAKDFRGNTLLHQAVRFKREGELPSLLAKNISLEEKNLRNRTPLQLACSYELDQHDPCNIPQPKVIAELCKQGAEIELPNDPYYPTLLHYTLARDLGNAIVAILLEVNAAVLNKAFARPEIKPVGHYPLHHLMELYYADPNIAKIKWSQIFEKLNTLTIDFNVRNTNHETPLVSAVQSRNPLAVKYLVAKPTVDVTLLPKQNYASHLDAAIALDRDEKKETIANDLEVLGILLSHLFIATTINLPNSFGLVPLHKAVLLDDEQMVKLLLEQGARLDVSESEMQTQSVLEFALRKGKYRAALALMDAKTFPTRKNSQTQDELLFLWPSQDGQSAFSLAKGNPAAQSVYLKMTAVRSQPLFALLNDASLGWEEKKQQLTEILTYIPLDSQNSEQQTALHWTAKQKTTEPFDFLLMQLVTDPVMAVRVLNEIKDKNQKNVWSLIIRSPDRIRLLRTQGIPLPQYDHDTFFNLLYMMVHYPPTDYDLVAELLAQRAGQSGYMVNKKYTTWLIEVIKKNDPKMFELFFQKADENELIEQDEHGFTPLHWAVLSNNESALKALLAKNVHLKRPARDCKPPLLYACGQGFTENFPKPAHLPSSNFIRLLCSQSTVLAYGIRHSTVLHQALLDSDNLTVLTLIESATDAALKKAFKEKYYREVLDYPIHILMRMQFNSTGWQRIFTRLIALEIDFNVRDTEYGSTSLHLAARACNAEAVRALLEVAKVDVTAMNNASLNVLHHTIPEPEDENPPATEDVLAILTLILDQEKGKPLLDHPECEGITPLYQAVLLDNSQLVSFLVARGAQITIAATIIKSQSLIEFALRAEKYNAASALLAANSFPSRSNDEGEIEHIFYWRGADNKSAFDLAKENPETKAIYQKMCTILGLAVPASVIPLTPTHTVATPTPAGLSPAPTTLAAQGEHFTPPPGEGNQSRDGVKHIVAPQPLRAPFSSLVPPSPEKKDNKPIAFQSAVMGWVAFYACATVLSLAILTFGIGLLVPVWPLTAMIFISQMSTTIQLTLGITAIVLGTLTGAVSGYGLVNKARASCEVKQNQASSPVLQTSNVPMIN